MTSHRNNPESEENEQMTRDNRRAVFTATMMEQKEPRFCILQDDDSHWYLVPADKREEAEKYFADIAAFWENEHDSDGVSGDDEPQRPDYIKDIDGPHKLTFTDPQET